MSTFWSWWVILLTSACLVLVTWVLFANRKVAKRDDVDAENKTTGHVYDGIEEYDNPLPKWWFQLFVGTLIFTAIYLLLYPGMGNWKGLLRVNGEPWTAVSQLSAEQAKAQADYDTVFAEFTSKDIPTLAQDEAAMKVASRLYANNCAVCHGADGGGAYGFPNLTDDDWLHGGTPDLIRYTIEQGRQANMPAWGPTLGEKGVAEVTEYVLGLSGLEHDEAQAAAGKAHFASICSACHGAEGKGQQAMGAPNLTDAIWLYEGSRESISKIVREGRVNRMPAQKDLLRDEKIHLLTAYVYSLSRN